MLRDIILVSHVSNILVCFTAVILHLSAFVLLARVQVLQTFPPAVTGAFLEARCRSCAQQPAFISCYCMLGQIPQKRTFIMAALCNRAGHYIFALWFLSIFLLFFLA